MTINPFQYLDENLVSPCGTICKVLDTASIDYSSFVPAVKKVFPLVFRANGGELIEAKNQDGTIETTVIADVNDAIFMSPTNINDLYIPQGIHGGRLKFDELEENGFKVIKFLSFTAIVIAKQLTPCLVLLNSIHTPTCIKDAFGPGRHQFLYPGAVLKKTERGVSGISKEIFDSTWEVLES